MKKLLATGIALAFVAGLAYLALRPQERVVRINEGDGVGTLAFEDYYPKQGDFDYNDLVINLKIEEKVNQEGNLESIRAVFFPRVHSGGYDHRFLISLRGKPTSSAVTTATLFEGPAHVSLTTFDSSGKVISEETNLDRERDVVIFESTNDVFPNKTNNSEGECEVRAPSRVAVLSIQLLQPELNPAGRRRLIDIRRYRFQLFAKKSQQYIELAQLVPDFTYPDGSPVALFIPVKWRYPFERTNANSIYPKLADLRAQFLSLQKSGNPEGPATLPKWYDTIAPGKQDLLVKCELDESLLK